MNNNVLNIYPDMSVRDVGRTALEMGCEVIIGNKPGEILLKHPSIKSSLQLSSDQKNPGAKFASWANPLIQNSKERFNMLNLESQQGRIAKVLQRLSYPDKPIVLNEIAVKFESILTKKQVSDGVSHLIRRGYVERLEPGLYKTTEMLNQAVDAHQVDESEKDVPAAPAELIEEAASHKPVDHKPVKIRRKSREPDIEAAPPLLESLFNRLEKAIERLEDVTRDFQEYSDIQNALATLEQALARKKDSKRL